MRRTVTAVPPSSSAVIAIPRGITRACLHASNTPATSVTVVAGVNYTTSVSYTGSMPVVLWGSDIVPFSTMTITTGSGGTVYVLVDSWPFE